MQINLVTPFAEKNAVKALEAKWNGDKKVWYIVDKHELTPFMRWIPNMEAAIDASGDGITQTATPNVSAPRVVTRPSINHTHCGSKMLT